MLDRAGLSSIFADALRRFIEMPPVHPRDFSLRATSGTSGNAPLIALIDQEKQLGLLHDWYWGSERVLICYGPIDLRCNNAIFVSRDPNQASHVLTVDGTDVGPGLESILQDFRPERIIGSVSFALRIAECMSAETAAEVRFVKCVGEYVTRVHQEAFAKLFPHARISTGYFTMEFGALSKETCPYLLPNHYHPQDQVRFEIAEPDGDGIGDILVSTDVLGISVSHYRVGDIGRVHATPCACGESTSIEVLGRRGIDYIKLAGALLVRDEFDRVVGNFHDIADYRVEARVDDALKGDIVIRAHTPVLPSEGRQTEIRGLIEDQLFLTAHETLADLVRRNAFNTLQITFSTEPFPLQHKAVKLRQV